VADRQQSSVWELALKALERTGALVIVAFVMYYTLTTQAGISQKQSEAIAKMTEEISAMRTAYALASSTQQELIRILDRLSLKIDGLTQIEKVR
jgi:hypothetical protein